MRISRVAVRPKISLAFAVSCTPGSCTTTRSAPCWAMMGSATPSSLMRLFKVLMFCFSAFSIALFSASGLSLPAKTSDSPSPSSCQSKSTRLSRKSASDLLRVSASRKLTRIDSASRLMPAWRMFLSRNKLRTSPANASYRLIAACFKSTCSKKCTPPRKSRPKYIGRARSSPSQRGEADKRFRATT